LSLILSSLYILLYNLFEEMDRYDICDECGGRLVPGSSGALTCSQCGLEYGERVNDLSGSWVAGLYRDERGVTRIAYTADPLGRSGGYIFAEKGLGGANFSALRKAQTRLQNSGWDEKFRRAVERVVLEVRNIRPIPMPTDALIRDVCMSLQPLRIVGKRVTDEVLRFAVARCALKMKVPLILGDVIPAVRSSQHFDAFSIDKEWLGKLREAGKKLGRWDETFKPNPDRYDPTVLVERFVDLIGFGGPVHDHVLLHAVQICDVVKRQSDFRFLDCEVVAAVSVVVGALEYASKAQVMLFAERLRHEDGKSLGKYFFDWKHHTWYAHVAEAARLVGLPQSEVERVSPYSEKRDMH